MRGGDIFLRLCAFLRIRSRAATVEVPMRCPAAMLVTAIGTAVVGLSPPVARASGIPSGALEEVTVTATRERQLIETADSASQGMVTAEELDNRPLLRPAEVLEVVPGLIVTQHSGDGKANQYFLRGFNLDHGIQSAERLVRRRAHSISGREPP